MNSESIEARVENACLNGGSNDESAQLVLYLNIADYINLQQGKGDCARNVVFTIAKLISSSVESVVKLRAIRLLDVLVKNCGYPIHLHISRKGFLKVISNQFHQYGGDSATYSTVQLELLMEINMWYHTICQWTSYKNELVYIKHLYNLIVDRGYHFPPLDVEELAVLKPRPHTIIRSFEEFNKEQRIILNSQISELRRRGNEKDLNAVNILTKKLRHFRSNNVTVEALREVLRGIEKWQEDIYQWNQKLDNNLLQDDNDDNGEHNINLKEMDQFIDSLKNVQSKIQQMLMEDLQDENFINQLFIFNDQTLHLLTKFESYQTSLADNEEEAEIDINDNEPKSDTKIEENLIQDMDKLNITTSQEKEHVVISEDENISSVIEHEEQEGATNESEAKPVNKVTPEEIEEKKEEEPEEVEEKMETTKEVSKSKGASDTDTAKPINVEVNRDEDELESTNSTTDSVNTSKSFSNPISLLNSRKKPCFATNGFMFKPKMSNTAPVTTFAVSKAESSGQFKFDGKSNEVSTNFKPFLDNPKN
ncbi:hypothetical protein MOUN0_H04214 [Monosporozyma unispora]|nr:hypothetical protein C6P44_004551 [Kazachstania unispora]